MTDSFYTSTEWRIVRYAALRRSAGLCLACGRGARHGVVIHVDHIKPRSLAKHLELNLDNLQVLCEDCNLGKVNSDCIDWKKGPTPKQIKSAKKKSQKKAHRLMAKQNQRKLWQERYSTARSFSASPRKALEKTLTAQEPGARCPRAQSLGRAKDCNEKQSSSDLCVKQVKTILRKGTTT